MGVVGEPLPMPAHLSAEFYAWLWWTSERQQGEFDLGGEFGAIDIWVDERLAFRHPAEGKVCAVMTGDNPSTTLEARAALAGGKVLQELRLGLRRDAREFYVTLRGAAMDFTQVKLPPLVKGSDDTVTYERMFLYEELSFVVAQLYQRFATERVSQQWGAEVLPAVERWVSGREV